PARHRRIESRHALEPSAVPFRWLHPCASAPSAHLGPTAWSARGRIPCAIVRSSVRRQQRDRLPLRRARTLAPLPSDLEPRAENIRASLQEGLQEMRLPVTGRFGSLSWLD